MATKLSLVMSGGVSLGSFQAGVLTELLYALDVLHRDKKEYELDVITGASAGSVTGALVAYTMMMRQTDKRLLYKAWVKELDVMKFLTDSPTNSFLSRTAEEKIARECIFGPANSPYPVPFANPDPAPFAPNASGNGHLLRMSFTLSNMNGIDRQIPGRNGVPFTSTFFDDVKTYHLVDQRATWPMPQGQFEHDIQSKDTWESIIHFGITSGAFPLAFPPAQVLRYYFECALNPPPDDHQFSCVDGGMFNNQPIGEAVRLSREADGPGPSGRKYLFVSLNDDNSKFVPGDFSKSSMAEVAQRVASIILAQSRVSDYIRAQLINVQTTNRNELFKFVHGLVLTQTFEDHGAQFTLELTKLATDLIAARNALPNARSANLGLDLGRRLIRVSEQYGELIIKDTDIGGKDPASRNHIQWLLFLVLDHIADLDSRQKIDIDIIAPKANELAGEQLAAFAGFFEEDWREYNFRLGRNQGHLIFQRMLKAYPQEKDCADYIIEPRWSAFPAAATMASANREKRVAFRDMAVERVVSMAGSVLHLRWPISWVARRGIRSAVKNYLNGLLEL